MVPLLIVLRMQGRGGEGPSLNSSSDWPSCMFSVAVKVSVKPSEVCQHWAAS